MEMVFENGMGRYVILKKSTKQIQVWYLSGRWRGMKKILAKSVHNRMQGVQNVRHKGNETSIPEIV